MAVTGIGGLFFRSRDPEARTAWYREHLGIDAGADRAWQQEAGMTVFAPFPADTEEFGPDQAFMLNLRVRGLDARAAGRGDLADCDGDRRARARAAPALRP